MAKNALPMPKAGGGILPKLLGVVVTLAVVMLVVNYPSDAANWVSQAMAMLGKAVEGLAVFLRQVLN